MSKYLVTGAGGFIGSAIVRALAVRNVVALSGRGDLDLVAVSEAQLAAFLDRQDFTHCIHAAWYTDHADYLTSDANGALLEASLRLAQLFGGRFIGLGTCLEYDLSGLEPCSEDRTPLRPATPYGEAKLSLFRALERAGGDFAWARVFFVYGPRDRAGRLIPEMLDRFRRGEVAGPNCGGLRRDYIHVDDLARQLVRIADSGVRGAINTGTGHAPSLSQIYAAGAAAFDRPELALSNSETGGQPALIQADMTRFRRHIGRPDTRDIFAGLRDLAG